jgi:hypothetical protein
MNKDLREHLKKQADQERKHAGFFSWHDRSPSGKGIAEAGVVSDLLEAMAAAGLAEYSDARASGDDWPDCWAIAQDGKQTAFEVSELVDEGAMPAGEAQPWPSAKLLACLQAIIARKDQRGIGSRGSRDSVLVVHTDEPYLEYRDATSALSSQSFTLPCGNLARAFLLFSYDPHTSRYPFIELTLAA